MSELFFKSQDYDKKKSKLQDKMSKVQDKKSK